MALVNERSDELNAIDYDFKNNRPDLAVKVAQKVMRDILKPGKFNERHFRKCLNTFRKAKSAEAVKATLDRLDLFITSADQITSYLLLFASTH